MSLVAGGKVVSSRAGHTVQGLIDPEVDFFQAYLPF